MHTIDFRQTAYTEKLWTQAENMKTVSDRDVQETFWAETETRPETHVSETETLGILSETRRFQSETRPRRWGFCPRRDVSTSRDRHVETETTSLVSDSQKSEKLETEDEQRPVS